MSDPTFLLLAKEQLAQATEHIRNPTVADAKAGVSALLAIAAALIEMAEHAALSRQIGQDILGKQDDMKENLLEQLQKVQRDQLTLDQRLTLLEKRTITAQPVQGPTQPPPTSPPAEAQQKLAEVLPKVVAAPKPAPAAPAVPAAAPAKPAPAPAPPKDTPDAKATQKK